MGVFANAQGTDVVTLFDFLLSLRGVMYLTRRFGNDSLKQYAMDYKYRRGHWGAGGGESFQFVVDLVEKYASGGKILELGCGDGRLIASLPSDCYVSYTGLDLSPVAIERATARQLPRTRFESGDMQTHHWDDRFDLVLFDESIYYLESKHLAARLQRLLGYLNQDGHAIVTIYQPRRFRGIIDHIRQRYLVVDEGVHSDSSRYFVLFKLEPGGRSS